jgi:histidine triad (HIT) family protein
MGWFRRPFSVIAKKINEGGIMTSYDNSNIFARILRGEIPCGKVYEDDHVLAFRDIYPKAPVHILVIPKGAYLNIADFGARGTPGEIAGFWRAVAKIADDQELDGGFRVIANTGTNGGQEVPHFHVHILGGRALGPMLAKAA